MQAAIWPLRVVGRLSVKVCARIISGLGFRLLLHGCVDYWFTAAGLRLRAWTSCVVLFQVELRRNSGVVQTWLILPVVICLSQRLSHACLSISFYMVKLRMAH